MTTIPFATVFTSLERTLTTARTVQGTDFPHSLALATQPDGTTIVYCMACDQDEPTHCCYLGWAKVCESCAEADWYLDILQGEYEEWEEQRWER